MSNCDNVLNTLPNTIEKLEVKDDKFLFFFDPIVIDEKFLFGYPLKYGVYLFSIITGIQALSALLLVDCLALFFIILVVKSILK